MCIGVFLRVCSSVRMRACGAYVELARVCMLVCVWRVGDWRHMFIRQIAYNLFAVCRFFILHNTYFIIYWCCQHNFPNLQLCNLYSFDDYYLDLQLVK